MNQNQRQYRQVQGGGSDNERWEPQKNDQNANYPKMIEGYLKDIREINGTNGTFNVGVIHLVNQDGSLGVEVDVSGGQVLDEALNKITLGQFVCIKYGGKVQSKTGGRSYNMWEVFVDDSAIPYQQIGGLASQRNVPPQNNNNQQSQQFGNNQRSTQNGGNNQQFGQQNQNFGNQQSGHGFGGGNQQSQPFGQGHQQNFGQGQQNAPAFNQQPQNNPVNNPNVQKTAWQPQQNTQVFGGNNQQQGQNFGGNQQQGSGNGTPPIFTGNPNDNGDLPF